MTREEVIHELCLIQDYIVSTLHIDCDADCFCGNNYHWETNKITEDNFRHDGRTIEIIKTAVEEYVNKHSNE